MTEIEIDGMQRTIDELRAENKELKKAIDKALIHIESGLKIVHSEMEKGPITVEEAIAHLEKEKKRLGL